MKQDKVNKYPRVFKTKAPEECLLKSKISCVNCEYLSKLTSKYVYCKKIK